jgi:o-succinylbenzoate synthase
MVTPSTIAIARYRSPLRTAMRFGGAIFAERSGFFVRIEGSAGVGIGEVAPLPGVHRESIEDCFAALSAWSGDESPAMIDRWPPSLAFGVSVALGLASGDPILCRPLRDSVGVNELCLDAGMPTETARTVKVKVGRGDLEEERRHLDAILRARPQARLRIDANRTLTLESAKRLFDGLDPARIDYLEEPLSVPLELPALHFATGLAIALDESLHEPEHRAALETAPGVVAHVVKPTLLGSVRALRARAERTARQQLHTTITSTFESAYSLWVFARLVTWLPNARGDHGLGTAGMLLEDPAEAPAMHDHVMLTQAPPPAIRLSFVPLMSGGAVVERP